jgi:hypothetical protein
MLEVQRYLRDGGTVDSLRQEFGIKVTPHPTDARVILNYDQIDSPKRATIARECRGLVLERGSWDVVARGFTRFFNQGECPDLEKAFRWDDFAADSKEDGSLMLLYQWQGLWYVNTRGSFATGEITPGAGKTWEECFWNAVRNEKVVEFLDHHKTYLFEFCSPFNHIVRRYETPCLYLLTAFDNRNGSEWSEVGLDVVAGHLGVLRPHRFSFSRLEDVARFLGEQADPTFEGCVLRDKNGMRLKVKNARYVALHHLKGNGNLFLTKNLLPLILKGETSEVLSHFPEAAERLFDLTEKVGGLKARMNAVWEAARGLAGQKEFAQVVTKNTRLSGILFEARKRGVDPDVVWQERAEDMLLKLLA